MATSSFDVNGLPLHVLLVHAVVILLPLTALCVVLAAVWPAARRRLGIVTPLLGLLVIGLVPLTMAAGQWLRDRVPETPLIDAHAALGRGRWPWSLSLSLGILAILIWAWYIVTERRDRRPPPRTGGRRGVALVLALLAVGIGGVATC